LNDPYFTSLNSFTRLSAFSASAPDRPGTGLPSLRASMAASADFLSGVSALASMSDDALDQILVS
jgi:hypothetical protein